MIFLYQVYNNRILKAYIEGSDGIKDFFRYSEIKSFLEDLQYQPIEDRVVSSIYKKNKELCGSSTNIDNIEETISLLRERNTVVVMSAHQPALLLGPLYIIYKAINIIKLSKRLKESYPDINFVPIFWIASEDSDISEVNFIYLENTGKILYFDIPKEDIIFSHVKKDPNWLSKIETALAAYNTSFKAEVVEFIYRAYEGADNLSSFFAALLVQLFKKYGLLVIDPSQDDIKHAVKDIYITEIEKPTLSTKILLESFKRLKQAKFIPILHKIPNQCNFFLLLNGKRYKVFYKDNKYFVGERTYYKDELLKLLDTPLLFSSNVVTRPISASAIFKNMIYISGPNELCYLAQLKDIFEFFNVKPPLILPRISLTLLEKHHKNILHKLNLTPEDFILRSPVSKKVIGNKDIIFLLKEAKDYTIQKIEELVELLPQIKDFAAKINKKVAYSLSLLEERCMRELINKDIETKRRIEKINNYFYPEGILQERLFNIFHFILKYGFSIIDKLFDKFPLDYKYHHFISV